MKKPKKVALIAAAILSATLFNAINSPNHLYIAEQNGGVNDPPDSNGIAMKPNGGSNDPPEGRG